MTKQTKGTILALIFIVLGLSGVAFMLYEYVKVGIIQLP